MRKYPTTLLILAIFPYQLSACPPGMTPHGPASAGMTNGGCRPISGSDSQVPLWENRWGATALGENSVTGWAADKRSKRSANRAALSHCKKRGGIDCKSTFTYHNQCVAIVNTDTLSLIRSAITKERAVAIGIEDCHLQNSPSCTLLYSDCSLPVRIR